MLLPRFVLTLLIPRNSHLLQWADTVKYTTPYEWSAPLHFVDANDSPLTGSCSVEEDRDCIGNQCILAAIANYTTQV